MPTPTSPGQPDKPRITPADAVAAIGRGAYKPQDLHALSDLSRADASLLASAWPTFPEETRINVLRQLEQIAENNVQYVFGRAFRVALEDPSPVARHLAISGMWEDEQVDLVDTFISMMENDLSTDVRAAAASALARYADLAVIEELDNDQADHIQESLMSAAQADDQPALVRRRALESVAIFGGEGGVHELIEDAYDSDDSATRASAIYAMGRSLDRSWLSTVLSEFESDEAELRYEAARASGELGHVDAVAGLSDLLFDQDAEVRHAAIGALGMIGGPGAIRVLRNYAQSCPPGDSELVDEALSEAQLFNNPLRGKP
jgi:HEAT repeat protein